MDAHILSNEEGKERKRPQPIPISPRSADRPALPSCHEASDQYFNFLSCPDTDLEMLGIDKCARSGLHQLIFLASLVWIFTADITRLEPSIVNLWSPFHPCFLGWVRRGRTLTQHTSSNDRNLFLHVNHFPVFPKRVWCQEFLRKVWARGSCHNVFQPRPPWRLWNKPVI